MGFTNDEQVLSLIRSHKNRDQGFRLLMNRYQEPLYQHIRRMVWDHDDTNDVLQNTFIKVFKNIERFEERSSLYTWIYRIATNEALSYLNNTKRKNTVFESESLHQTLENRVHENDSPVPENMRDQLLTAMNQLPEKQKSVFSLRYFEEMSYKQMAEVLNTSEGALKASFHHAVKKIESYFKMTSIY